MQPARSLVMAPLSTVWTHTFSRVCANLQAVGQSEAPAYRAWARTPPWASSGPLPLRSPDEVLVPVQLPPVLQATSPGKDAGNGVRAGRPALGGGRQGSQGAQEPKQLTRGPPGCRCPLPD